GRALRGAVHLDRVRVPSAGALRSGAGSRPARGTGRTSRAPAAPALGRAALSPGPAHAGRPLAERRAGLDRETRPALRGAPQSGRGPRLEVVVNRGGDEVDLLLGVRQ